MLFSKKNKEYSHLTHLLDSYNQMYNPDECGINFKVADMQFTFNNSKLIDLMQERGSKITECKDLKRVNQKMHKLLISDFNGDRTLDRILTAYITFQTEDGHDEA